MSSRTARKPIVSKPLLLLTVWILLLQNPVALHALQWDDAYPVSSRDMDNPYRTLYIPNDWKYQAGDSAIYASPDFDDWDWMPVSTVLGANQFPFIEWTGIGWFRITLDVDSSLIGIPFALDVVMQSGASEIYMNGELLYQFGQVSADPTLEMPYQERKPRSLVFREPGKHVIAVRYSNHNASYFVDSGYNAGFKYQLVEMNHQVSYVVNLTRQATMNQYFFSGILLVFTLIHFLLFLFYSKQTQNLFFAVFTACFGILTFLNYQTNFSTSGLDIIGIIRLQYVFIALTITFFIRFAYSLFYHRLPKPFWLFVLLFIVTGVYIWRNPLVDMSVVSLVIMGPAIVEIVRVLAIAVIRKRDGAYIFTAGMVVFLMGQIYQALVNLNTIQPFDVLSIESASVISIVALLLTMSVSLSRNFAETNRRLEFKLNEVKELSEKTIEQERIQKEKELEKRLLEADNQRKTAELEEARNLQLSMLPRKLPRLSGVEVEPFIQTATEVGGDYYDVLKTDDQSLTVVIGDATGHGVKAGMVVATAKSYFHTFAPVTDSIDLIRKMSHGIKNMHLHMLYMSLAVLKIHGRTVSYVGAGMPPILIYRASTGRVETMISKGMPLGSVVNFPYQQMDFSIEPGDAIVMMSDGLTEAYNRDRDMLGLDKLTDCLRVNGNGSAKTISESFQELIRDWTLATPTHDDITVIALKFT
jgi:serine phosphatase RsbU (regulator of sigma subunit)